MPNTDVYRAIDAVLVLGVDDNTSGEGQVADSLITTYDLSNVVGRLRNVTVTVQNDLRPFYEIGRRYAVNLRPGIVHVAGTAERALINGALLRLLLGNGATSPPDQPNFIQPAFNLITTLTNPAQPDNVLTLTLFGVKFASWSYSVPAEEFVMEAVSFAALRIAVVTDD